MQLKRLYNFDAPPEEWWNREEPCSTCDQKGVVINETLDGVETCPICDGSKVEAKLVPPLVGVAVLHAGPKQNLSPRIVGIGRAEGWLEMASDQIIFHAEGGDVVYSIVRPPGRYNGEQQNYYECVKE